MSEEVFGDEDTQVRAIAETYDCPMEVVDVDQMLKLTPRQLEGVARIQEWRGYLALRAEALRHATFMHNKLMRESKP